MLSTIKNTFSSGGGYKNTEKVRFYWENSSVLSIFICRTSINKSLRKKKFISNVLKYLQAPASKKFRT
jgi:hypothetical protein